ncbi:hypothetical protein GWI33_006068 [Rhynchophorus ferrugineus]|uniref:Uncharacterized protein n=1 Tax=Rhynchophorus ferrugineus TaxID=354439 RepID=A0A834MHN5_RHYFE|nr:hypothetical protein GWI33_006068 [Rhynchophorus ferrugineus]
MRDVCVNRRRSFGILTRRTLDAKRRTKRSPHRRQRLYTDALLHCALETDYDDTSTPPWTRALPTRPTPPVGGGVRTAGGAEGMRRGVVVVPLPQAHSDTTGGPRSTMPRMRGIFSCNAHSPVATGWVSFPRTPSSVRRLFQSA